MGESLQEYFWIQDFEVDLTQNVNLKMLNLGDYDVSLIYTQKNNWRILKFFWLYKIWENNFQTKYFCI